VVVRDNEELLRNWEALKAEEKRAAGERVEEDASLLDGVSSKAPALMEAHQLTTKAARVGFDWRDVDEIFDKLHEEVEELREAIREKREAGPQSESASEAAQQRVREEVGDLLFAVTNIARHLDAEPEAALKLTNRKFRRRFRHIERGLKDRGRELGSATIDEMEELWQEAKGKGGGG
jgi:MazG family protein